MGLARERILDWDELDRFVHAGRGACFYHTSTWLRGLEEVYGFVVGLYTWREGGELLGLLPFVDTVRLGLRHRQSLPFGTYGGPVLAADVEGARADDLRRAFLGSLGGRVQRVTLVEPPEPARPDPPIPAGGTLLGTQILDLAPGWDEIFRQRFRKERRRQIRKAQREGVEVARTCDPADVAAYHPIYLEHARDWGLAAPTPLAHLQQLVADTEGVRFWVARHEGEIVGGHLNLHFGGMVTAWNGTARKSHRHLAPSVLLYAENLRQACEDGESHFNFGGSGANDPLFAFKAAFGAEPVGYVSQRHEGLLPTLAGRLRSLTPAGGRS